MSRTSSSSGGSGSVNFPRAIELQADWAADLLEHMRSAIAIRTALGDRLGLAMSVRNMGHVLLRQGRYRDALDSYREALATLPAKVPLSEINIDLPWRLPVPEVLWFDSKLRVWLSAQDKEWIMGRGICEWLGWKI